MIVTMLRSSFEPPELSVNLIEQRKVCTCTNTNVVVDLLKKSKCYESLSKRLTSASLERKTIYFGINDCFYFIFEKRT